MDSYSLGVLLSASGARRDAYFFRVAVRYSVGCFRGELKKPEFHAR
jgi:hypothetical protein